MSDSTLLLSTTLGKQENVLFLDRLRLNVCNYWWLAKTDVELIWNFIRKSWCCCWHTERHCVAFCIALLQYCDRLRLIPSNHKSWLAKLTLVISYQVLFWFWHLHCYNLCLIPCNLLVIKIGLQQNSSRRAPFQSPIHWFTVSQNTNVADYLKILYLYNPRYTTKLTRDLSRQDRLQIS